MGVHCSLRMMVQGPELELMSSPLFLSPSPYQAPALLSPSPYQAPALLGVNSSLLFSPSPQVSPSLPSGPFSPRAELTNGRAAMLGFAVLCALEYTAGVSFF